MRHGIRTRWIAVVALVVACGGSGRTAPPGEQGVPWAMFQRDPAHTGRAASTLGGHPALKWSAPNLGYADFQFIGVRADGVVYALQCYEGEGIPDQLIAVTRVGRVLWQVNPWPGEHSSGCAGAVVSGDGGISVLFEEGGLVVHFGPGGGQAWQTTLPAGAFGNAMTATEDGTLVVSTTTGMMALDATSGNVVWRSPATWHADGHTDGNGYPFGFPAATADGIVFSSQTDGKLYALHTDGSPAWSAPAQALAGPAVAEDGTVYVGTMDGALAAFTSAGKPRWKAPVKARPWSIALAPGGLVYVEDGDTTAAYLEAFDASGTSVWSVQFPADVAPRGQLVVDAGGTAIVLVSEQGGANPSRGEVMLVAPGGAISATISVEDPNLHAIAMDGEGTAYVGGGGLFAIAGGP